MEKEMSCAGGIWNIYRALSPLLHESSRSSKNVDNVKGKKILKL